MEYHNPLDELICEFSKMPGIGKRTAQRIAFYLLSLPKTELHSISGMIGQIKDKVGYCQTCFGFINVSEGCLFCDNNNREKSKLCVVTDQKDLLAMESMGRYLGLYHVLGGVISPLEGIGPDSLRIKELLTRIDSSGLEEVIFALKPTVEGEATTLYIKKLLSPFSLKITQIAYGIPVGGDLEWADQMTLYKSFEGRRILSE